MKKNILLIVPFIITFTLYAMDNFLINEVGQFNKNMELKNKYFDSIEAIAQDSFNINLCNHHGTLISWKDTGKMLRRVLIGTNSNPYYLSQGIYLNTYYEYHIQEVENIASDIKNNAFIQEYAKYLTWKMYGAKQARNNNNLTESIKMLIINQFKHDLLTFNTSFQNIKHSYLNQYIT